MKSRLHCLCIVNVSIVYSSSNETLSTPFGRSAISRADSLLQYQAIWTTESHSSLVNNLSPFPCLRRFILGARLGGFALLPVFSPWKNISCKNDCTRQENLVNFFSFFKARTLPKMNCWRVLHSILLLQEIINLRTEHHQRLHLAHNFTGFCPLCSVKWRLTSRRFSRLLNSWWTLTHLVQNHNSEAFPAIKTCPHCTLFQALRLKGKVVHGLNASHVALFYILERAFNFCVGDVAPFHPSPFPILFNRSLRVTGVVLVVSFFYESPHVTFKCGSTAIANIFAGLRIAEVVL